MEGEKREERRGGKKKGKDLIEGGDCKAGGRREGEKKRERKEVKKRKKRGWEGGREGENGGRWHDTELGWKNMYREGRKCENVRERGR